MFGNVIKTLTNETIMYSRIEASTSSPRAHPGHLTLFPAREGGNLITTHRGGEFELQPRFHDTSGADSAWVD